MQDNIADVALLSLFVGSMQITAHVFLTPVMHNSNAKQFASFIAGTQGHKQKIN